jgi:hypothetical protein
MESRTGRSSEYRRSHLPAVKRRQQNLDKPKENERAALVADLEKVLTD